jgi:hypothetical protein
MDRLQELTQRVAEPEKERDHWKANHDQQVERARVLVDRPDMPLERVKAYKRHAALLAFVEALAMDHVEARDIGPRARQLMEK